MSKENLAFLFGGFAFGLLVGYGLFNAISASPELAASGMSGAVGMPSGPQAPSQAAPGQDNAAPMIAEINRLKSLLQEKPEDLRALTRLANIYHDVGMWDQAITFYDRAIEIRPDDPNLLTDSGICLKGLGQFDRAMERFDRAQEIDPDHWQSLFNKVVVAGFDQTRFDVAMEALKRLEALNPPPPRTDQLRDALEQRIAEAGGAEGG